MESSPRKPTKRVSLFGFKGVEESFLKFPIRGLTLGLIERRFKLAPNSIDYFEDEFGEKILPDELTSKCQTSPYRYYIILKPIHNVVDCLSGRYHGGKKIYVYNVPWNVRDVDLSRWILEGLISEDIRCMMAVSSVLGGQFQIQKLEQRLADLRRQGGNVDVVSYGENMLQNELANLELNKTKVITARRQKKKEVFINVELVESIARKKTRTWTLDVRSVRKEDLGWVIVNKKDWKDISLALGNGEYKSFACRGPLPWDKDDRAVNMRNVRFERHMQGPNGVLIDEDGAIVRGQWLKGQLEGEASIYNARGFTKGVFRRGVLNGMCKMTLGAGDKLEGHFTHSKRHEPSSIYPQRYESGQPHGMMSIQFSDGATYEGEMKNGEVTGKGKFISAIGEIHEGVFLQGQLHGHGKLVSSRGDTWEGQWEYGILQGKGSLTTRYGEVYKGFFDNGALEGRGSYRNNTGEEYVGHFVHGIFQGRGTFHFKRRRIMQAVHSSRTAYILNKSAGSVEDSTDYAFHGPWKAGKIWNGGLVAKFQESDPESETTGQALAPRSGPSDSSTNAPSEKSKDQYAITTNNPERSGHLISPVDKQELNKILVCCDYAPAGLQQMYGRLSSGVEMKRLQYLLKTLKDDREEESEVRIEREISNLKDYFNEVEYVNLHVGEIVDEIEQLRNDIVHDLEDIMEKRRQMCQSQQKMVIEQSERIKDNDKKMMVSLQRLRQLDFVPVDEILAKAREITEARKAIKDLRAGRQTNFDSKLLKRIDSDDLWRR